MKHVRTSLQKHAVLDIQGLGKTVHMKYGRFMTVPMSVCFLSKGRFPMSSAFQGPQDLRLRFRAAECAPRCSASPAKEYMAIG